MLLEQTACQRNAGISITPLIDVVFILLLFFMLSSTFSRTQQIEVRSAPQGVAQAQPGASQRLLLYADGQVSLGGVHYALDSADLRAQLDLLAQQDSQLVVAGTAQVRVQALIALVDRARSLGIEQINIAESVAQ